MSAFDSFNTECLFSFESILSTWSACRPPADELHRITKLRDIGALLLRHVVSYCNPPFSVIADDDTNVLMVMAKGQVYEGRCSNGWPEGSACKMVWNDGTTYIGDFEDGLPNGEGLFIWPRLRDKYQGDVVRGLRHGFGSYFHNSGSTYHGIWAMSVKHGIGLMLYPQSDHYLGEMRSGLPHGVGVRVYFSGSQYVGEWEFGQCSGYGVACWGVPASVCHLYRGNWISGTQSGVGHVTWLDHRLDPIVWLRYSHYDGELRGGVCHGTGRLVHCCGTQFDGQWLDNAPVESDESSEKRLQPTLLPSKKAEVPVVKLLLTSSYELNLDYFLSFYPDDLGGSVFERICAVLRRYMSKCITFYQYFASRNFDRHDEIHCSSNGLFHVIPCVGEIHGKITKEKISEFGRHIQGNCLIDSCSDFCKYFERTCSSLTRLYWWVMLRECRLFNYSSDHEFYEWILNVSCGDGDVTCVDHPNSPVRFGHYLTSLVMLSALELPHHQVEANLAAFLSEYFSLADPGRCWPSVVLDEDQVCLWFSCYQQLPRPVTVRSVVGQFACGRVGSACVPASRVARLLKLHRAAPATTCGRVGNASASRVTHLLKLHSTAPPTDSTVSFLEYCELAWRLSEGGEDGLANNVDRPLLERGLRLLVRCSKYRPITAVQSYRHKSTRKGNKHGEVHGSTGFGRNDTRPLRANRKRLI